MQNLNDYKRFAILYVDDEEISLKYFARAFSENFRVLTASNAQSGYELLERHQNEIGVLITDQRMPGEKGVQFLEKARQLRPQILRILATAYSDLDVAIQAVNTGAIYKYISKPWEVPELEGALKRALGFFSVQRERDQLLREKLTVLHNLIITDRVISLGVLASGLGHYVRNALVAVQTFLELAPSKLEEEIVSLEEMRNPNFWKDFHKKVCSQVGRISEMLTDLEAVADKPPLQFNDKVQLRGVLNRALEKMAARLKSKNIAVENQIPEDLPTLDVNAGSFNRLFSFLLEDELVSLPDESKITFRAAAQESGPDHLAEIRMELQDNGPGLPKEALRTVFDPFFLRKDDPKEFGINLMACYFIVYHHGGRVEIRSQAGEGTQFIFTFPTRPPIPLAGNQEQDFLSKVLLNDRLWEKLLAEA